MAYKFLKEGILGSEFPYLAYKLYAEETSASGTKRTVRVKAAFKINASQYNTYFTYPMDWNARIHNSWSGDKTVKGWEAWRGTDAWREYTWTATVDVGTTGSTGIIVGFVTKSYEDTTWSDNAAATFTVSSTNQPPKLTGALTTSYKIGANGEWVKISDIADGPENQIKIPETASHIKVDWQRGTDDKGEENIEYRLHNQQNESSWSTIYKGRDITYEHNIGTGNEGRSYDYYVDAVDASGAGSNNIDAIQFIKNAFTPGNLNNVPNISYDTNEIALSWSNPSNTNGDTNFDFDIICEGVLVHNAVIPSEARSITIQIVDTAPAQGIYIFRADLISRLNKSDFKGNINFVLNSTNVYGTRKTSTKACVVNLQTNPNPVTTIAISTDDSKSTAYRLIESNNERYFIPDGSRWIKVEWNGGSDKLGGSIVYDLYVKYGTGGWELIRSNLPSSTNYYDHVVPTQSSSVAIKYKITVKTNYGTMADKDSIEQTLHYYRPASLFIRNVERLAFSANVTIETEVETSIKNPDGSNVIGMSGTWQCYNELADSVSSGYIADALGVSIIEVNNLTEESSFELKISFNDNSGLTTIKSVISEFINSMKTIMLINKHGLGLGGAEADETYVLKADGSIMFTAGVTTELLANRINTDSIAVSNVNIDKNIIAMNDTSEWCSLDLYRQGGYVRYGIGYNKDGASPSIEYWQDSAGKLTSRTNLNADCFELITYSEKKSCFLSFYNDNPVAANRLGFVGRGNDANTDFTVHADKGVLVLKSQSRYVSLESGDGYVYSKGHLVPYSDNTHYLGTTSPAYRWKQLCAVSSTISTSDSNYKKNIEPIIDDTAYKSSHILNMKIRNQNALRHTITEGKASQHDYYDFIKDRFMPYSYDYIVNPTEGDTPEIIKDKEKMAKSIGFIADQYDLINDKVAKEFIFESSDGMLNYNTDSYTTVVAIALKEAIKKIEWLEKEIIRISGGTV